MSQPTSLERLERALTLYQDECVVGGRSGEDLLREHPELADLLEPLVNQGGDDEAERPGHGALHIPGYHLIGELGRGGMGVVFEAEDLKLHRRVALKVLAEPRLSSPKALLRFHREAAAAAKLRHPGLVSVLAFDAEHQPPWLAMEKLDGVTLDQVVEHLRSHGRRSLDGLSVARAVAQLSTPVAHGAAAASHEHDSYVAAVVSIAADLAAALAHAHGQGVVHRDVKPANIMLCRDGRVVITDFGVARPHNLPSLTVTGDLTGTPLYMSPEAATGRDVDHRTDVFSLGATLYELLTLHTPFAGASTGDVLRRVAVENPTNPRRLVPNLPRDLVAVVEKALEKNRARRYQTAAEFETDLRAFLAYRPVKAQPLGTFARLSRWVQREPLRAALAAVLALGVPTLAALTTYVVATRDSVEAGELALREAQLEDALLVGYLASAERDLARARQAFDAALALRPDCVEATAGRIMAAGLALGAAAGLHEFAQLPEETQQRLLRLRLWLETEQATITETPVTKPATVTEVDDALDAFLAALIDIQDGQRGDDSAYRRAAQWAELSLLLATTPRAIHAYIWADGVSSTDDVDGKRRCARVMEHRWPNSWYTQVALAGLKRDDAQEQALAHAQRATEMAPDKAAAWHRLGDCLEVMQRNAEAIDAYTRAHAIRPSLKCLENLAVLYGRMGQGDRAQEAYGEMIRQFPDAPQSQRLLGSRKLGEGKLEQAIDLLQRSVARGRDRNRCYAYYDLGRALKSTGRAEEAEQAYRDCLQLQAIPEAMVNLGNLLRARGAVEESIPLYRRAIQQAPQISFAWSGLLLALHALGQLDEAETESARWVAAYPERPEAWRWRSQHLRQRGDAENRSDWAPEAMAAAKHALQLFGRDNSVYLYELALCHDESGDAAGAIPLLERALELSMDQRPPRANRSTIESALAIVRGRVEAGKDDDG